MLFVLIAVLLLALWTPYQVHRRRTPFYVGVSSDADSIKISVYKRGFADWPNKAADDLGLPKQRIRDDNYWLEIKTISIHADDADEKMLETVVATKTTIEKWKTHRETASNLEVQARKALKR